MNKSLPTWLTPWLSRPSWQLLVGQWLLLMGLTALPSALWVNAEWQQHVRLQAEMRQQAVRIGQLQQQLSQQPALYELQRRLAVRAAQPVDTDLSSSLQQAGVVLLRWQQQEASLRQTLNMRVDYAGLLRVLNALPTTLRIERLGIDARAEGLIAELVLRAGGGDEDAN
ncbi:MULTISPECIES: hypothetical protein [Gammaproteobacteria]|uniref:hypothetical protein n=1 Tax=Gammaproteobacteria TaxID=1236 RepID=UPI0021656065|nr:MULTISPECIES: hypothetical protein [Gammaproteobacteria]MCS3406250.1 hypothetical protein [Serratia sp. AKBS12]MDH4429544.1 hypothetical protein [Pseudomonas shirazica]HEI8868523.1 hypothetical protein [Serratia odorifera]